jgi:hypothetical protein
MMGHMSNTSKSAPNKINQVKEPRVNCRVPLKLYNRINKIAARLGVDASDVVRMGLNQVLPSFEK